MLLRAFLLIAVVAPASLAGADTHFTFHLEREMIRAGKPEKGERQKDAWVGATGARVESRDFAWIYQAEPQRLLLIDHTAKTYQVFPIPFSVLDYQPEDQREQFRQFLLSLAPQTRLEGPGDVEAVGERQARRWVATVTTAGAGSYLIEAWISPNLGERCATLERLLHAHSALNTLYGDAERQLLDLPGCAVRHIVRQRNEGVEITTEERLMTLQEVPPELGRYAPPIGYREVPVDQKVVGGFFPGQPLPSH